MSISREDIGRGGQRRALRGADGGMPRLPGVVRRVHARAPARGRGGSHKIPRLSSSGNSPGDLAGQFVQSAARTGAPAGLEKIRAGLSGGGQTFCGGVERSGALSALRKFHGKKRVAVPALGMRWQKSWACAGTRKMVG